MGRVYEGVGDAWVKHNEWSFTRASKRGKRVSFEGANLYSYSTIVARYRECPGGVFVLATNRHYSLSTSSHVSNCVGHCDAPVFYTYDIWASDEAILTSLMDVYEGVVSSAIKGWKKDWWDWSRDVIKARNSVTNFCRLTGLEHTLPPINEITASIESQRQAKADAWNDPKAVAARERAAARREAKLALDIAA